MRLRGSIAVPMVVNTNPESFQSLPTVLRSAFSVTRCCRIAARHGAGR